jgi:hypothetical protein
MLRAFQKLILGQILRQCIYLNFYQKKIDLKAQTPTNESTKQDIFCKSLVFFSFSPQLYSDLSFLAKLLIEYYILQILNQRFGLIAQTPTHESTMQEFFLQILDFFFIPRNMIKTQMKKTEKFMIYF